MERKAERDAADPVWQVAVTRSAWFIAFWFALSGFHLPDFPAAVVAVSAATWVSLQLLPVGSLRPSVTALSALAFRFLQQSIVAGADVAWRALDPRLPLQPGLVTYDTGLPPGPARNAFLTLMSLLPGSLPALQDAGGRITIHCLDVSQPVAAQMAEEEKRFVRALGINSNDG